MNLHMPQPLTTTSLATPIAVQTPRLIEFGAGVAPTAGRWAREQKLARILVVADTFNAKRVDALALKGEVMVFGELTAEPDVPLLDAGLALARRFKPDLVIGFGGGSAMDLAKLIATLGTSSQVLQDVVGAEKISAKTSILMHVPTTSGTGSEAGTRALLIDPVTQNKLAVQSRHMLADIAIIDPALTLTLPPTITATTGVDAMAHCVEAFTNKKSHPFIDMYALEGIRLVGRYLARAVKDGSDIEARAGLSLASLYGGFCLGPVNTSAGHAVAYPLGTRHHVPHGAANALIFPHTLAFNASVVPDKTTAVLAALGCKPTSNADEVRALAHRYCSDLGCEMRLSALKVAREDLPIMASEAHAIRRLLDNNPREISRGQILALYEEAY